MQPLRVVEKLPGHRFAYGHADRQQRETEKTDEAEGRDGLPHIFHEITN